MMRLTRFLDVDAKLTVMEWQELLTETLHYEAKEWVAALPLADVFLPRLGAVLESARSLSAKGFRAQMQTIRLLIEAVSAISARDSLRLESAFKSLFELGKTA